MLADTLRLSGVGGKGINERPVARMIVWRDLSEGAPCARLSNSAFNRNIRETREKCPAIAEEDCAASPDSPYPRLIDVRVVEAQPGFSRRRPHDLNGLTRNIADAIFRSDVADEPVVRGEGPFLKSLVTVQPLKIPSQLDGLLSYGVDEANSPMNSLVVAGRRLSLIHI